RLRPPASATTTCRRAAAATARRPPRSRSLASSVVPVPPDRDVSGSGEPRVVHDAVRASLRLECLHPAPRIAAVVDEHVAFAVVVVDKRVALLDVRTRDRLPVCSRV